MNGQYEPGERLRIAPLAEQMGVSITPVREAIFRLVSEQGLEMKAATAVHVPVITADHLREIQLIRHHLEGAAAERAATNMSRDDYARLEDLQERFVAAAAASPKKASKLNREFHFAIMEAARFLQSSRPWRCCGSVSARCFRCFMHARQSVICVAIVTATRMY